MIVICKSYDMRILPVGNLIHNERKEIGLTHDTLLLR